MPSKSRKPVRPDVTGRSADAGLPEYSSRWFPEIKPSNIRILVVDDDEANLDLLTRLLSRAGFQVAAVSDGRSCLKRIRTWKPDLVVCDVILPDFTGREICRRIKASPFSESTFVALISSQEVSAESTVAGLRSGADAYIARPIANQELVAKVHTLARIQQTGLALRESERRFQTLARTAPVGIIRTDAQGRTVYVNDYWCAMSGLKPDEAIGRQWSYAYHPEDVPRIEREWHDAARRRVPFRTECRLVRPDGSERWVLSHGATEAGPDGEISGFIGALVEITDRKAAEDALAALNATLERRVKERTAQLAQTNEKLIAENHERLAAEQRFARFMDNVPLCAWMKDSRFRYTYVNKEAERVFKRPLKDWIGRTDSSMFPRPVAQKARRDDRLSIAAQRTIRINESVPDAQGRIRHYVTLKFPLTNPNGQICPAGVAMDITEKIEAAEALRQLPYRIIEAQENERHRVARELHDGVSQLLASVRFRCQRIVQQLKAEGDSPILKEIGQTKFYLERALQEVREISHNLRPSELDDFGLASAMRSLGEQFSLRNRVTLDMKLASLRGRLPPEIELALYRILQETLSNVEKHAQAKSITVTLARERKSVCLTISDDGRGFSVGRRSRRKDGSGLGLINIRERAAFIDGTVAISSKPRQGTRIEISVPLRRRRKSP